MNQIKLATSVKPFIEEIVNYIIAYSGQEFPVDILVDLLFQFELELVDPLEFLEFLEQSKIVKKEDNGYFIIENITEDSIYLLLN